jgi:hypothetical protein
MNALLCELLLTQNIKTVPENCSRTPATSHPTRRRRVLLAVGKTPTSRARAGTTPASRQNLAPSPHGKRTGTLNRGPSGTRRKLSHLKV